MFADVFIGKIYAFAQGSIAVALAICSGIVASDLQCNNTSKYAVSLFILIGCVTSASGAWGSRLLAKTIGQLKIENANYENNNKNHDALNKQQEAEVLRMKEENELLRESIGNLSLLVEKSEKTSAELESEVTTLKEENIHVKENLINLSAVAEKYEKTSKGLESEVARLSADSIMREELIKKNEGQIHRLEENNHALESQTKKLQQVITMAENNRIAMENQLRDLMASLAENGDNFVNFNEILKQNVDKSASTAEMMDALLSKLGTAQFKNIDKDGDGVISKDELMGWAKNQTDIESSHQ